MGGRRPSSTRSPGRWTTREPFLISGSRSASASRSDAGRGVSGGRGARPARPAPRRDRFAVPRPARSAALAQRARMGARDRGLGGRGARRRAGGPRPGSRGRLRPHVPEVASALVTSLVRTCKPGPASTHSALGALFRTVGLRRGARGTPRDQAAPPARRDQEGRVTMARIGYALSSEEHARASLSRTHGPPRMRDSSSHSSPTITTPGSTLRGTVRSCGLSSAGSHLRPRSWRLGPASPAR